MLTRSIESKKKGGAGVWTGTANTAVNGIGNHNYCRNPTRDEPTAWCYTTDSSTRLEMCDVGSPCKSCLSIECASDQYVLTAALARGTNASGRLSAARFALDRGALKRGGRCSLRRELTSALGLTSISFVDQYR